MANLDDELAAAMAGLGQAEVVPEEFEEHPYASESHLPRGGTIARTSPS